MDLDARTLSYQRDNGALEIHLDVDHEIAILTKANILVDDDEPDLIPLVFTWHVARLYAYNFRDFFRILVYRLTPQVYREKDPVFLQHKTNPAKEIQTQSHARQFFFQHAQFG